MQLQELLDDRGIELSVADTTQVPPAQGSTGAQVLAGTRCEHSPAEPEPPEPALTRPCAGRTSRAPRLTLTARARTRCPAASAPRQGPGQTPVALPSGLAQENGSVELNFAQTTTVKRFSLKTYGTEH